MFKLASNPAASVAPTISKEKEFELIAAWQDHGDIEARNALVAAYRPLLSRLASQARKKSTIPFSDLLNDAAIALMRAIDKFDLSTGARLATYGTWQCFSALETIKDRSNRDTARTEYVEEYDDQTADDNDDNSEARLVLRDQIRAIGCAMRPLTDMERSVIAARYLAADAPSFRELSLRIGVTGERIRHIESIAIRKMRVAAHRQGICLTDLLP